MFSDVTWAGSLPSPANFEKRFATSCCTIGSHRPAPARTREKPMLPAAKSCAPLGAVYSVVSAWSNAPKYDWTNPLATASTPYGSAPLSNRWSLSFWYRPAMVVRLVAPVPAQIHEEGSSTWRGAAAQIQSPYICPMSAFSGRPMLGSRHKQVAREGSVAIIGSRPQYSL